MRKYLEFVRFSHTLFALPFALASLAAASRDTRGWPGLRLLLLVLAAMVCARTAAMGFNRIVDRHFDARNPRTAGRHLVTGAITLSGAWCLVLGAAAGLAMVAWLINPLCFRLSPVALAIVGFYSLTKRFTDWTHFFLGLGLAVAPVGAWLAVRGRFEPSPLVLAAAVVFWLVGFDIIYATQDYEADRAAGLRSLPVRWGIAASLHFARAAHAVTALLLAGFGLISGMGWPYFVGLALIVGLLVLQHLLARHQDPASIDAAFFRANAGLSLLFLAAVVADVLWR
ncbi:UbiA family prenyltransferase [bacterium]|nr:UbiA family prenyltransferase [bacterium]